MDRTWDSPTGPLELLRGDGAADLRAWDGADRYLVEAVRERHPGARLLVVDDRFGALTAALAREHDVVGWGDSAASSAAIAKNLARNGLPAAAFVPAIEDPPAADVVVGRLPRGGRRLEYALGRLGALAAGTPMLFGDRSKEVQKSTVAAFDGAIGPAKSTLARHRARLVTAVRDERPARRPASRTWEAAPGLVMRPLPGVFAEAKIDPGSRLLARSIAAWPGDAILDLGCGSGVLGLLAGRANPSARVTFVDASHCAVESARRAWAAADLGDRAEFAAVDVLEGVADASQDVVLCNPPFHQGRAITRAVALRMAREARRVLRPGGRLLLVGNRHLGYHVELPRWFDDVRVAGSDRRFVVFSAS